MLISVTLPPEVDGFVVALQTIGFSTERWVMPLLDEFERVKKAVDNHIYLTQIGF